MDADASLDLVRSPARNASSEALAARREPIPATSLATFLQSPATSRNVFGGILGLRRHPKELAHIPPGRRGHAGPTGSGRSGSAQAFFGPWWTLWDPPDTRSSVFQAEGRGFESRLPLTICRRSVRRAAGSMLGRASGAGTAGSVLAPKPQAPRGQVQHPRPPRRCRGAATHSRLPDSQPECRYPSSPGGAPAGASVRFRVWCVVLESERRSPIPGDFRAPGVSAGDRDDVYARLVVSLVSGVPPPGAIPSTA
jgi:hypothetical protein